MNHWAFVTAAYTLVVAATAGLAIWSWLAMRRAEAAAEAMGKRK